MKTIRIISIAIAIAFAVVAHAATAAAAEIRVLCSVGLKAVADELVPQFERATKNTVVVKYDLASSIKKQIDQGEPFDVAFVTPGVIDDLIAGGKIAPPTRAVVAQTGLAIAIRSGARKPDIRTVEAFKRALLDAKSIAYAKEGASGVAFAAMIQKMGIADALQSKSILTTSGEAVGEAIVSGKAEFGVLPVSEILPVRGAEVLATFPAEVQSYVVMVGGASTASKQSTAARDLIAFFTAPAALPVIRAKGMERK
jgi:molybdate transport system substrate-binding protein